jgi:hypothetical protein
MIVRIPTNQITFFLLGGFGALGCFLLFGGGIIAFLAAFQLKKEGR